VPVTKQYLVPANGQWCLTAGKVVWRCTVVPHWWAQGLWEGDEHPHMRLQPLPEMSTLSDGSRRSSGSAFQGIGPATENARRPSVLRRSVGWSR